MGALTQVVGNAGPIAAGILAFRWPLNAAKIAGAVLTASGAFGYLRPVSLAKVFGIPFANPTNSLFVPGIGGRNLATGLSLLTLAYLEEKRALGVEIAFWTLAGWSDVGLLMATEGSENVFVHVRNTVVLMLISYGLLTN